MSTPTTIHIINHTHWDREWFLTSEYTSRWIPRLIDRIQQLAASNPDYRFLFDGQTLVIEDLLLVAPEYEERAQALIKAGNLQIGPYYCQPDWQLTGGELLIRNLLYGQQVVARYGGTMEVGWLVDTFGHISQSPQIHRLFAIDSVYVWRGVPVMHPYFKWQGADGSELLTINLFGGYRNLYGVTHVPQVAVERLYTEVRKLTPYYPTSDVPLFDGYDLEDDPEDPVSFYAEARGIGEDVVLVEKTAAGFALDIEQKQLALPTVTGELNSGKYGATFPGTFSARTYLKIMAHDCERLLFQVVEPLAVLARLRGRAYDEARYEIFARRLLRNAVHDCICGVSIDLVHEKMEDSYHDVFRSMLQDVEASLAAVMADFQSGEYAVCTTPFIGDTWQVVEGSLIHARTEGVGVWPVGDGAPVEAVSEPVSSFHWRNDHYEATVTSDGTVRLDEGILGSFVLSEEHGDTYSAEPGRRLGAIRPESPPLVVEKSERHCVVYYRGAFRNPVVQATVEVRLHFDPSPLIRWEIDLDTRGTDLRVDMLFETGGSDQLSAAMPFDVVKRPVVDRDLLPRELSAELANVLLGQRELDAVSDFPFRDFIASGDGERHGLTILTKGTRTYKATEDGTIVLPLRRAVEWLTKADLRDRIGDAGPFFYVPDARCERRVRHEIAVVAGPSTPDSMAVQRLNAYFQNPPLIVRVESDGTRTRWQFMQEDLPLSSLSIRAGAILGRFYNPSSQAQQFSQAYRQTDVWGRGTEEITVATPKKIVTVQLTGQLPGQPPPLPDKQEATGSVRLLTARAWRVGTNKGRPDPAILDVLTQRVAELDEKLAVVKAQLAEAEGPDRLRWQHRAFVLQREQLEYRLSYLLNQRKLDEDAPLRHGYLYTPDPEIAEVGQALNRLRIKRRIFDYVVQAL